VPTEFYQTQLLPRTFQQVATTGPGTKINDLMVRAYIANRQSIPTPGPSREYPGGHAELLRTGVFSPVVKCDVESLYPSIMLRERITSARDTLNAYLPMLEELTKRRLHAKGMARKTTGQEQYVWDGLQSSFKVLINSFYGYLGFGAGLFNDFDAARAVTISGQRLIKSTVAALDRTGAITIEVDTDGVYFVPPDEVRSIEQEQAYIEQIGSELPSGIRLAHDGGYQAMLSLRLKNYALLGRDGSLTLKGSALRSRRLERCFRDFLTDAARSFMTDDRESARERYFALAEQIKARALGVDEISQWAMIHDSTVNSQPRLKRLLDRLPGSAAGGERVKIYEREDGELATTEEYSRDENIPYLLKKLNDTAHRFEDLFSAPSAFDTFFPLITGRTDIESAKSQEGSTQLSLF
jgi:DNA polymerase I